MSKLALIALISFVSIAVFSFVALGHGSSFVECARAVLAQNMNCAESHSAMNIVHAKIFKAFSEGILSSMLLLLIAFVITTLGTDILPIVKLNKIKFYEILQSEKHFQIKLRTWFIEKKDAIST